MNWDAIAAIGQSVSALALFLVVMQVRHAREEMRRSVSQGRAEGARQLWMSQAESAQLGVAIYRTEVGLGGGRASASTDELVEKAKVSIEDARQVIAHQFAWWVYQSRVIRYADQLDQTERVQFDLAVRFMYGISQVGRYWYQTTKDRLDPDAVRYVDHLLAQPDSTTA